jgi:hypothetical protein
LFSLGAFTPTDGAMLPGVLLSLYTPLDVAPDCWVNSYNFHRNSSRQGGGYYFCTASATGAMLFETPPNVGWRVANHKADIMARTAA